MSIGGSRSKIGPQFMLRSNMKRCEMLGIGKNVGHQIVYSFGISPKTN